MTRQTLAILFFLALVCAAAGREWLRHQPAPAAAAAPSAQSAGAACCRTPTSRAALLTRQTAPAP